MSIENYKDPIVSQWNRYAEIVENEPHVVTSGMFALVGLPDVQQRVVIDGYVEIGKKDEIRHSDEFKVDYTNGYVFMHSSKEGETVSVTKYASRGANFYPASRVWTKLTADGDIDETLEDITVKLDGALDLSNQIQQAEDTRISSEIQRSSNEITRKSNEVARNSNEDVRVINENTRISDEGIRRLNEVTRESKEDARTLSEIQREADENIRIQSEIERVANEDIRKSGEQTRVGRENIRESQESERQTNTTTALNSLNDTNSNFSVWEDYDNSKIYKPLNKVQYQGSSYVNILECQGVIPTDINNWQLVASKGQDGTGGDMYKYIYDTNDSGKVDMAEDSEKLGGKSLIDVYGGITDSTTNGNIVVNGTEIQIYDNSTVESNIDGLAGVGRTTETVKDNSDRIGILNGIRVSVGTTQPTDTVFWLDTSS